MEKDNIHIKLLIAFCAALLFLCGGRKEAYAQQVGVKTNALMWAMMTPNLGCEVVVGEHSSLDLSAFGHDGPYGLDSKVLAFQPEYRYWFNGRPMVREYVGVSAMIATYDMMMNRYVYDGNAFSIGLTGGYSFVIGANWRFELCGGFSFLFFRQNQYYATDEFNRDVANSSGYKLFPAKLGVSFTYIIR